MSRADRWWRPTSKRPAVRSRTRMYRYNQFDVNLAHDRGLARGIKEAVERHEKRDDMIRRLADAAEKGEWALEELKRELDAEAAAEERRWWSDDTDDLTDVAREAGVLDDTYARGYADGLHRALSDEEDKALWDSVPPAGEGVVVEIEQWLRERNRWLDNLRERGDLPDEQDGGE